MKAITFKKYGSPEVLEVEEMPVPTPKADQILVKVKAASQNAADWHVVRGKPFFVRFMVGGLSRPKKMVPGADVAGIVASIGKDITKFKVGDEVFGDLSSSGWGAFGEYVCANENAVILKPKNISFEEAAASCLAAVTALQGLKKGNICSGIKVLINGASGGVGTFAVQIAKSYGADVTAVCSTQNVELVKSIGADRIIDYKNEDFTKTKERYDLILAVNGKTSIFDYVRLLNPKGIYVMIGGAGIQISQSMLFGSWISLFTSKKVKTLMAKPNSEDQGFIGKLLEEKKVVPVIDKVYRLEEAGKALAYLEEGHAKGKVVLKMP